MNKDEESDRHGSSFMLSNLGVNRLLESANLKDKEDTGETRLWSNSNFRYIFDKLFEYSIDMPVQMWNEFDQYEMVENQNFTKSKNNKKISSGPFVDYDRWTFKASYEELYEPLFLDSLFDKGANRITKAEFIEKMTYHKRSWMLDSLELRKKYTRFNNRYDAEKQNKPYESESLPFV